MAFEFSQKRNFKDIVNFIIVLTLFFILIFVLSHFFLAKREKKNLLELKIYKKINVDFSIFENEKFKKIEAPQEIINPSGDYHPGRENPFILQPKKK